MSYGLSEALNWSCGPPFWAMEGELLPDLSPAPSSIVFYRGKWHVFVKVGSPPVPTIIRLNKGPLWGTSADSRRRRSRPLCLE